LGGEHKGLKGAYSAAFQKGGIPMLAIAIFGAAVGAVLSLRYRMVVLMPAMVFASAATLAVGFASGANPHSIVLAILAILASLQFGYVAGGLAAAYLSVQTTLPHRTWTPSQY
jgi:hypothetical protein